MALSAYGLLRVSHANLLCQEPCIIGHFRPFASLKVAGAVFFDGVFAIHLAGPATPILRPIRAAQVISLAFRRFLAYRVVIMCVVETVGIDVL